MFSARVPRELTPNALSARLTRVQASGRRVLDLTQTNPTAVGLPYPARMLDALANPAALTYAPRPFGIDDARRAVAAAMNRPGVDVPFDRVVLTASTSEAYSFLFKLLAEPGEAVLVPRPSYPLFDLLCGLESIRPAAYDLVRHDGWTIDRASLERGLEPSTRAVLVVSPNNPTGSMLNRADREWLVALAADRQLALIADEVFHDYPLAPRADATSLAGETRALTFTLGGLSKSAGLPQAKLAWIVASGPSPVCAQALERLEIIADTYLSVSTPVQCAAPDLIAAGAGIRHAIAGRLAENLQWLRGHLARHPAITLLEPEAGWSVVLRIPAIEPEERVVVRLLDDAGVLVHPGYFFDFPDEAFLVLSLLPEPQVFQEGVSRAAVIVEGQTT